MTRKRGYPCLLALLVAQQIYAADFSAQIASERPNFVSWGKFMNCIFDRWAQWNIGEVFVMNFEQTLAKMCGELSACVINETCGTNLVVEANGDIYSCDHFVYPENKPGNLHKDNLRMLVNSPENVAFGRKKEIE